MHRLKVTVLMVDDHRMVREALVPFVRRIAPDVTIFEANTIDEACRIAADNQLIDLVVLDLYMPGMDNLQGLALMRQACPLTPIVILSSSSNRDDMRRVLDAGAAGYVPKTMVGAALTAALMLVLSGERFMPAELNFSVIPEGERHTSLVLPSSQVINARHGLTQRQWAVLELVVVGWSNKEIARRLNIEEITVKVHVQAIFRKMHVVNRTQATARAWANGWLWPDQVVPFVAANS